MQNQFELYNDLMETREKLYQATPEITAIQKAMIEEAYKDGALSRKFKRLMALAISIHKGCVPCILSQVKLATEAGASKAEVLETTSVVRTMSGTTGIAESIRVMKLLEELGTK